MYPVEFMQYLEESYRDLHTLYTMGFCKEDQFEIIADIYEGWSGE